MRNILRKSGLLALLLLIAAGLHAQESPDRISLSLAEAKQYAVDHNRTLANASIDIRKAQANKWKAIAALLPQVTASGSYTNMMGYKMDLGQMQISMPPYATFGLQTAVGFNGASIIGIQVAKISSRMSDITLEKTEKEICDQVATLYFSALVAEKTIGLLEQNLQSMQKLHDITQKSVDVGVAEQTDADQLMVQVATMASNINTARNSLEMVYNSLRLQLCLEDDVRIVLTDGLDDLMDMEDAMALLTEEFDINRNYDYRLLKENTELTRKQIAMTAWSAGPTLSVFHQYSGRHNFSNEPTMNMTPPNQIGAQLSIPLFTSGKTYASVKDARLAYDKQLNTLEDTELALYVQHDQLVYDLSSAIEKYEIQKQNMEVAQRVFDNIARKYEQGVASSLDVTNSGTNLLTAQSSYIQTLLEIITAQVALEQLLNK